MERQEFKCTTDGCQKVYSNSFNLKRHFESFHCGIKKFFCNLCNKGLSSKQNLREHHNIHLDIKPYICTYQNCHEAYRQASQLTLHLNMHFEVEKRLNPAKAKFTRDISYLTKILSNQDDKSSQEVIKYQDPVEKIQLPPIRFELQTSNSDEY